MCRFTFYFGPNITISKLVTEPEHSLVHQSYRAKEREEPLNGDGFGLAWFNRRLSDRPAVFREVQPAWSSLNLLGLAPVSETDCLLAHVRAASPGLGVSQTNCHPFSAGRLAFMHNGEVGGFFDTRRKLRAALSDPAYELILGTTDSEVLFASIVDRLGDPARKLELDAMANAVHEVIQLVESEAAQAGSDETSFLNTVLTDGDQAVVTRYVTPGDESSQSLYMHRGSQYRCEDGVCYMDVASGPEETLVISSEPLSSDAGWEPIPENHMVLINREHRVVEMRPIETVRSLRQLATA